MNQPNSASRSFHERAESYALEMTMAETDLLRELREATARELRYDDMLSGPLAGTLLHLLAGACNARRALEIGTFTGYATLQMAMALPPDGLLFTCESNDKYAAIAERFFRRYREEGGKAEIRLLRGPALATLSEEAELKEHPFDFIFLDADKEAYPDYYERLIPLLRPGGMLVVDNAFWGGKVWEGGGGEKAGAGAIAREVFTGSVDRKAAAIDRLNRIIAADPRVENVLLPVRDGMHLIRKRIQVSTGDG
ncbi:class I SAM-dependent methyltransferase [Balneolales bacterium ANBcel1]|nr:class I SAM-dependent methyltransferase [Balneolales bacterium ANBcel1]